MNDVTTITIYHFLTNFEKGCEKKKKKKLSLTTKKKEDQIGPLDLNMMSEYIMITR